MASSWYKRHGINSISRPGIYGRITLREALWPTPATLSALSSEWRSLGVALLLNEPPVVLALFNPSLTISVETMPLGHLSGHLILLPLRPAGTSLLLVRFRIVSVNPSILSFFDFPSVP
jgi:hypothetical protein